MQRPAIRSRQFDLLPLFAPMAAHDKHHFIPDAFLSKWHSRHSDAHLDNKLRYYRWTGDRLVSHRRSAKSVARVLGLYAWQLVEENRRNEVERETFQPLDNDAAVIHAHLLSNDIPPLSRQQWEQWTRFLTSLMVRLPQVLDHYTALAPKILSDLDSKAPEGELAKLWRQVYALHANGIERNVALGAIKEFLRSSKVFDRLLQAEWVVRNLPGGPVDLVLSDAPLLQHGSLGGTYFLALPIAPRKLFIAHNGHPLVKHVESCPDAEVIWRVNNESAMQAHEVMFTTGEHHERLARRLLGAAKRSRSTLLWSAQMNAL